MEVFKLIGKVVLDGIDAAKEGLDKVSGTAESSESRLTSAFKKIGAAVVTYFAVDKIVDFGKTCVSLSDDVDKAMNNISASTGIAVEKLDGYEDILKGIYENNYGENFEDIGNAVATVKKNLDDLSDQSIQTVTESAFALRDTFEYDIAESTRAAKAMTDNFGISAEEAFNLIASGAQNGLDYSGELIDSISEYSVQFAKVGMSAEDMFAMFQKGADSGAWNLDKVGDAIKEFSIRSIDGSKTTIEGFEAIGLNADEMAAKFGEGGESARKAFAETVAALSSLEDPLAKDAAGVALFGTMWEDLGPEVVGQIGSIKDNAYEAGDALNQIKEVKYDDLGSALETLKREVETALIPIGDSLVPIVTQFTGYASENLIPVIEKISDFFVNRLLPAVIDVGGFIYDTFFPIIQNFGKYFSEELLPIITKFVDYAKDKLMTIFNNVKTIIENNADKFDMLKGVLKNILEVLSDVGKYLLDFIEWMTGSTEGAEKFRKVIEASAIAFVTYKTIMFAFNTVMNAGRKAVQLYHAAVKLLNTSNPFGWVALTISGIVALTAALEDTDSETDKIIRETGKLSEEQLKLAESINKSYEEYTAWSEAREKEVSGINAEFDYYAKLKGELQNLADENGNVNQKYQDRAKFILGELSEATGVEYDLIDGQIQKYDELIESIDLLLQKKKFSALVSAGEDDYNEAVKALGGADGAEATFKEAEKNYIDAVQKLNAGYAEKARLGTLTEDEIIKEFGSHAAWSDAYLKQDDINISLYGSVDEDGKGSGYLKLKQDFEKAFAEYGGYKNTILLQEEAMTAQLSENEEAQKIALEKISLNFKTSATADAKTLERQTKYIEEEMSKVPADLRNTYAVIHNQSKAEWSKAINNQKEYTIDYCNSIYDTIQEKKPVIVQGVQDVGQAASDNLAFDGATPANNSMSQYYNAVVSWQDTIVGTIQGLRATLEAAASGMEIEVGVKDIVASAKHFAYAPATATGGIVTRAQTRLVGEDGAEAIIPLEKNTEWIDRVAERMSGNTSNSVIAAKLDEVITLLKTQKIYLDGRTLVGGIANEMDKKLGSMARLKRRGI